MMPVPARPLLTRQRCVLYLLGCVFRGWLAGWLAAGSVHVRVRNLCTRFGAHAKTAYTQTLTHTRGYVVL